MLIYLSYRNEDSFSISELFKTQMIERFGKHRLVMDAAKQLPIGVSTLGHIRETVSYCDLMIVLIGPEWAIDSETGESLLNAMDDVVRMEVEAAQYCKIRIVPVLIKGAKMPPRDHMPIFMRDIYKHPPERIFSRPMENDIYLLLKKYTSKSYIQQVYIRVVAGGIGQSKSIISGVLIVAIILQIFSLINSGLASLSPTSLPNISGLTRLGYYFENITDFAFSVDGDTVTVMNNFREVSLWDYVTGTTITLEGKYRHFAIYPNDVSLFLLPEERDSLIRYSRVTDSLSPAYNGENVVRKFMFNTTGSHLITWDMHSVAILAAGTKATLNTVDIPDGVIAVSFTANYQMIWVMSNSGLYLWDAFETDHPARLEEMLVCEGCTPRDMVVDTEKGVVYYLYDDAGQSKIATVSQQNGIETVINEPLDAQYINLNSAGGLIVAGNASQMVFWTTTDWQVSAIVSSDGDPIVDVEFSPQGDLLAVLDSSGTLTLWGVED